MLHTQLDSPHSLVYNGDCREIMRAHYERGEWIDSFDFVFSDPPFNVNQSYDVYLDDLEENEFARFFVEWIAVVANCVRPNGIVAINVPDQLVHLTLQTCFAFDLQRVAWVLWHYRFGQCNRSNWINSKAHCLIFRAGEGPHVFNSDAVLVDSDRATKYGDGRTLISQTPCKRIPLDVWGVESDGPFWGRVQGNNSERIDSHPNQLPEKYLERLIRAYTNVGDWVLDPFGGTGTTATVARALGRHCATIELSQMYCDDIAARLNRGAIRV